MKKIYGAISGSILITLVAFWSLIWGGEPELALAQAEGRQVSLVSTEAECLTINAGSLDEVPVTVDLRWIGQIDRAAVVLAMAGSTGGHSLSVNGQIVGQVPASPDDDTFCQPEGPPPGLAPAIEIPLSADILKAGKNTITLTNDANLFDDWTAISIKLRIYGDVNTPPAGQTQLGTSDVTASATPVQTTLPGSYFDDQPHQIWYQQPDSPSGSPTPLLVAVHGMGQSSQNMIGTISSYANDRGWLLVAPEMHNRVQDVNIGSHAIAWPGAQHDIIAAIEFMIDKYNVDKTRIYIIGLSMGGQTTLAMRSKYPDVFAAAAQWMGYTDLSVWYNDLDDGTTNGDFPPEGSWPTQTPARIAKETTGTNPGDLGDPPSSPDPAVQFEYERRSPILMAANGRLVPLQMWHNTPDLAVLSTTHPIPFQAVVNSSNPITPSILNLVNKCTNNYGHCYSPADFPDDMNALLDHLDSYTLNPDPPSLLTIKTDESKAYYWLNIVQTGDQSGDHWTEVKAEFDKNTQTVTAIITDTKPLTLAFNLGSDTLPGSAGVPQAGLGFPAASYRVEGGGNNYTAVYASGYFTVNLSATGQYALTIFPEGSNGGDPDYSVYLPVVMK